MNQALGSSVDPVPAPAPERLGWRQDGPRFALVVWVIATVAMTAAVAGVAIVVSVFAALRAGLGGERSSERLGAITQEALESESFTWMTVIASQAALLACAWLACRLLGSGRTSGSVWSRRRCVLCNARCCSSPPSCLSPSDSPRLGS